MEFFSVDWAGYDAAPLSSVVVGFPSVWKLSTSQRIKFRVGKQIIVENQTKQR